MWDLTGPGMEPVFPALTGGSLITRLPGKPRCVPYYQIHLILMSFCHLSGVWGERGSVLLWIHQCIGGPWVTGTLPGVGMAADILGRMETRVCVRTPWRADIHSQ